MACYSCPVQLMESRDVTRDINSKELVPGDVIVVPENTSLPCDLILLTGSAIVNEAMLTGESVPVLKTSIPVGSQEVYQEKEAAKHTLYDGT